MERNIPFLFQRAIERIQLLTHRLTDFGCEVCFQLMFVDIRARSWVNSELMRLADIGVAKSFGKCSRQSQSFVCCSRVVVTLWGSFWCGVTSAAGRQAARAFRLCLRDMCLRHAISRRAFHRGWRTRRARALPCHNVADSAEVETRARGACLYILNTGGHGNTRAAFPCPGDSAGNRSVACGTGPATIAAFGRRERPC